MQGTQNYQARVQVYVDIAEFVPLNHLLRKVDSLLDLSFLKNLTATYYSKNQGRPSIDPQVFFRMILVGYLYGIKSDRRLCEEITYNLAYRWFCRLSLKDKVPDHSSLTRIRDRLDEGIFSHFFLYVLELCKRHNLLKGESIIMDSTLVDADAGLNSLKPIHPLKKEEEHPSRSFPFYPPSKKLSSKTHISTTDPEASLAQKRSGLLNKLKYKVHNCIDAHSRVIIDTYATPGKVHDSQVCLDRVKHLIRTQKLRIIEFIADRAYGTAEIITALEELKITTYVPLYSSISGSAQAGHLKRIHYDAKNNRFVCSQGKYLETKGTLNRHRQDFLSRSADCKACPAANTCEAEKRPHTPSRIIQRNIYQDLYKRVSINMQAPLFIRKMLERRWKIEGIFAEAKSNHGLRRAKYRGLKKMQIQAYMIAIAQNIKRLIQFLLLYLCVIFFLVMILFTLLLITKRLTT